MRPSVVEDPLRFYQSDIGANSQSLRSSVSHKKHSSTRREFIGAADLVLIPGPDLQANRDRLVLCSSSRGAHSSRVSEPPSALLLCFQRNVHSCGSNLGYEFVSSLQHVNSPGSVLSDSQPPSSCGSHNTTLHESVQADHFHATQALPYHNKYTAHHSRPASACIHLNNSVPTPVLPHPSVVPLPSIYWLLFDRDEHSVGGRNGTPRGGTSLSPPGHVGGNGVATALQASATPVSFLAKWEDILALERSIRLSFDKHLLRAKRTQSPEIAPIDQSLGASLASSGRCLLRTSRSYSRGLMYPLA